MFGGDSMRRLSLAVVLLVMAVTYSSRAQADDALMAAYRSGDYATALRLALAQAPKGDRMAAAILGTIYLAGQGTPQDLADAKKWLTSAAEAGEPSAQYNLAEMYLAGMGIPQDAKIAETWFEKSARQGNLSAAINVGLFYRAGVGVEKNFLAAWHWFLTAAKQNSAEGAFDLGAVYDQPMTMRYDDPRLAEFFKEIGREDSLAKFLAGKRGNDTFSLSATPSLALPWYRVAAERGLPQAQLDLGDLYLRGQGVKEDGAAALKWFGFAAAQVDKPGHVDRSVLLALVNLGVMYRYGWGTGRDEPKAEQYYRKAVALENDPAFKQITGIVRIDIFDPDCGKRCIGTFVVGPGNAFRYRIR
jgi:uncharacterized protein